MKSHSNLPPVTGPNSQITNSAVNNDEQLNHPPYNEMITAAIVAMKERNGSRRQAIANYIESEYKNLPPSHATLLTQQLRKMKYQGQLVMNKRSYMLSESESSQSFVKASAVTKRSGRPPKIPSNGGGVGGLASPAVSCFSGLPVNASSVMIGEVSMVVPMREGDGGTSVKRHSGRPPKLQTSVVEAKPGAEAVSVGRRLERPPKGKSGIVGVGIGEGGSVLGKRGRGCVVKEACIVSALVGNCDGVERGCGWPHKNVVVNSSGHGDVNDNAVFMPVEGMGGSGRASKIDVRRPRKQPRVKNVADIVNPCINNEGAAARGIIGVPSNLQGGPASDPVELLCAQCRNLQI